MGSLEQLEAELDTLKAVHQDAQSELVRLRAKYDKDISDAEIAHQAEVARLREMAEHRGKLLVKQLEATQAETRAHEATKAEAVKALGELNLARIRSQAHHNRAEAAEARVAELKRELVAQELRHVRTREERAALAQARGLLERATEAPATEQWWTDRDAWLRAHPATAPERQSIQAMVRADLVERERLGIERYGTALYPHNGRRALQDAYEEALDLAQYLKQALVEQSTPAAAGAERVNAFILREVKDGALDNPGGVFAMLVERAEKEQGT